MTDLERAIAVIAETSPDLAAALAAALLVPELVARNKEYQSDD